MLGRFDVLDVAIVGGGVAGVIWNTVYLDRAVQHLRALGGTVPDDLLAHVAPLGWEHTALTGDYVWADGNHTSDFRPLRSVPAMFLAHVA